MPTYRLALELARTSIKTAYIRHCNQVKRHFSNEQLLCWNIEMDGWSSLCEFIGKEQIPSWPVPNEDTVGFSAVYSR